MAGSRRRETLDQFTERAIRATDAGKLIPPIVYLPSRLRGHNTRLTIDQVRITTDPPTIAENHLRIGEADPLGFLIALMHGQPIPAFEITKEGSIKIQYEIADLAVRERVAKWLANKVTIRNDDPEQRSENKSNPNDWDEIVARREQGKRK
jgi:hypothetical protein